MKYLRQMSTVAGTVLALLVLAPSVASAQDAAIEGRVTDTTSLILPGVTVAARHVTSGQVRTVFADGAGTFTITALQPGTYDVTFTLPGFATVVREGVAISVGATVTLDVEMPVQLQEQVVVVGSRAQPRSVTESTVPIDAIPFQDIVRQGATTLDYQLRTLVPSFNVVTHPISDAATLVRPASLRNLAHDHTLVLVNGKRRHRSSVITWINGVSDGAQGPDISTIPSIALRQVEVLRDGASAQYGSDAIAGVLNFLLKDDRAGGSLELNTGTYRAGDGDAYTVAGNVGLPIGATGFANLSLEYGNADPTDRSVQRTDAAALIAAGNTAVADPAQIWGNPMIEDDLKLFANFGNLFASGLQVYGHANYADKTVTEGFYFRNPNTRANIYSLDGGQTLLIGDVLAANDMGSANCPTVAITDNVPDQAALAQVVADPNCFSFQEIAPGGFTPRFGGNVTDMSAVAGLRRLAANGLTWDASASYGAHQSDFFFNNTVNASLGPDTPRDFNPGLYRQEEVGLNVDVAYAATEMVNVAGGAEWRDERFEVGAGGRPSWEVGPYAAQGFVPASNGFPGFADYTAGTWTRGNVAVYGDLELRGLDDRWTVGGAVRVEHFDLFGATTNGKLSARYGLSGAVAVRGGVSTGFRAPTPGQQNAINVQTELNAQLELTDSATVPSTFAVAASHGGAPLRPETSRNTTAGLVVDTGPFTATVDYFRVDVSDRLALTQTIATGPNDRALLLADGITSAGTLTMFRFFTNDFSTRTQGIDIVATYTPPALAGQTVFSFALNRTDTAVTAFNADLLNPGDILALEQGVPETRWNVAIQQRAGRVGLLGRLHYYGSWVDVFDARQVRGANSPVLDGRYIVDLEGSISLADGVTLAVGGQNVFDVFSDRNDLLADVLGVPYSQFTPWGFSGGYYYARVNYRWGR